MNYYYTPHNTFSEDDQPKFTLEVDEKKYKTPNRSDRASYRLCAGLHKYFFLVHFHNDLKH
jgi:hypothetical protein